MTKLLCFEDFYYESEMPLNEANQETLKNMQNQKAHFNERAQTIKLLQQKAAETLRSIKEREGKTKDPITQKIYQARSTEETMRMEYYSTRLEAIMQAAKIIDQKILIINLRLQAKAKKQIK